MKYRIKNPEVEKAIRHLYKANFPFDGLTAYERIPESKVIRFYVNEKSSVSDCNLIFELHESLVEEIVEYDSKVWNPYPQVQPPKEGWYRIQYEVDCVGYVRHVVYWNGKEWETYCSFVEKYAFSFKPWDDDGDCFQIGKEQVNDSVKKVELTVEEAKAINDLILKLFYNEENRMSVFDATELLTKRIEQSGGK